MKHRERVQLALNHLQPDRGPISRYQLESQQDRPVYSMWFDNWTCRGSHDCQG
jgi:hypothetical protein